jgi:thioesterase domain-containing protein
MNGATALNLPASMLFDHPSIEALARYIGEQVDGVVAGRAAEMPDSPDAAGDGAPADTPSIGALYERAEALGRSEDGTALLEIAARLRPTFELDAYEQNVPRPVRLSKGPDEPMLICLPSMLATAGPHQYVGFARHFIDKRDVSVVPNPGFLDGEMLPASLEVVTAVHAAAIRECAEGKPYVLLGHSTGGLLAHAVAQHLCDIDEPPTGVVEIDTYSLERLTEIASHRMGGMKQQGGQLFELTDQRLTAMVAYREFLTGFEPGPLPAACLLINAADPMPGMINDEPGKAQWDGAQTVIDVPGNHFSMMEEHVLQTAQATEEWLRDNSTQGDSTSAA